MNAPVQLQDLRRPPPLQVAQAEPDYGVDLFSVRGFKLAHRIAEVFASSDAVPAIFRSHNLKKGRNGEPDVWVENPSAIGNCVVAIETARAVGMSITAVMQHANIIEGKLSWSAQFVIAAINASGRFTPLRFETVKLGPIKAKFREKMGWNKARNAFDFVEREVEVVNVRCIAWALPRGMVLPAFTAEQMRTATLLELVRAAGLPVVESAPVSVKMAVEEGWYSKPGSKWQTEMRDLMLQYRAGAFFGRVHAPDIVMGMGPTSEERIDMTTVDVAPDGRVTSVTTEELLRSTSERQVQPAEVVERTDPTDEGQTQEEVATEASATTASTASASAFDANAFADRLQKCGDIDALDVLADELRSLKDADTAATLTDIYKRRRAELQQPAAAKAPAAAGPAATAAPARRSRPVPGAIE
jgi:hypothetical protein